MYKPCSNNGSLGLVEGGVTGGVNQGLLPMTISDEESNLFCACHLLKCYEGEGQ
jgi:hypothetical protein